MTSPSGHPYHPASSTRPGPSRRPRRTNGILDARIRRLSKGPLANRTRAKLLRRIARRFAGEPCTPQSDTFTFQVAEPNKMASFFQNHGRQHHIRKFVLEFDWSSPDRRLDTPEQVEPYITALQNLPSLEDISFDGVSIGPWAAFPLAEALRAMTGLRRADFSNSFAQREAHELSPAMGVIALALVGLPSLASINLSANALGPHVQGPVVYLAGNHTPLQELNLNDTGMGPETGVAIATALVSLAAKKADAGGAAPPLRSLLLNMNKLCQDDDDPMFGMEEWAAALAAHPHLTTVTLLANRIQHGGLAHLITHGLAHCHDLEVLVLADNIFTARGETHRPLAAAVSQWPALRVLDLDESLLGSRGAALLFAALAAVQPGPSRLESLKLKMNNLNPENLVALAGVLWRLPALRELTLDDNNFRRSDEGYQMLVRLMRQRGEERGVETSVDEVGRRRYSAPSLSPNSQGSTRTPPPEESSSSGSSGSSGGSSQSSSP